MATKVTEIQHGLMHAVRIYEWTLTDDETGEEIIGPGKADGSIQAYGDWQGATLTIEGTLIPDQTVNQFFDAKDAANTAISLTADGGDFVLVNFYRMRPKVTGGASCSLKIYILLK